MLQLQRLLIYWCFVGHTTLHYSENSLTTLKTDTDGSVCECVCVCVLFGQCNFYIEVCISFMRNLFENNVVGCVFVYVCAY